MERILKWTGSDFFSIVARRTSTSKDVFSAVHISYTAMSSGGVGGHRSEFHSWKRECGENQYIESSVEWQTLKSIEMDTMARKFTVAVIVFVIYNIYKPDEPHTHSQPCADMACELTRSLVRYRAHLDTQKCIDAECLTFEANPKKNGHAICDTAQIYVLFCAHIVSVYCLCDFCSEYNWDNSSSRATAAIIIIIRDDISTVNEQGKMKGGKRIMELPKCRILCRTISHIVNGIDRMGNAFYHEIDVRGYRARGSAKRNISKLTGGGIII